jgi:hypothetical protein
MTFEVTHVCHGNFITPPPNSLFIVFLPLGTGSGLEGLETTLEDNMCGKMVDI